MSRNVVEDIANVELQPTYISVVDQSGTSTDVLEKLQHHKVNTECIRRVEDGLGTRLAASVIATKENVCPRFLPEEFGL